MQTANNNATNNTFGSNADVSKTPSSSQGSKNSIDSTKDVEDGVCNNINDSEETILTIITNKKSKRSKDGTKFYRYEVKKHKKMVRILTVVAYVICVSMAAIVLSLYYVFLWDPNLTKYRDVTDPDCDIVIQSMRGDGDEQGKAYDKCTDYLVTGRGNGTDSEEQPTPYVLPLHSLNQDRFFLDLNQNRSTNLSTSKTFSLPNGNNESATGNQNTIKEDNSKININLNREKFYVTYHQGAHSSQKKIQPNRKNRYRILSRSNRHLGLANDTKPNKTVQLLLSNNENNKISSDDTVLLKNRTHEKSSVLFDIKFPRNQLVQFSANMRNDSDEGVNHVIEIQNVSFKESSPVVTSSLPTDDELAKLGSAEELAKLGNSEEFAKLGDTEEFSKLGNAEEFGTLGNAKKFAKVAKSEEFPKLGNEEEFSKLGNAEEFVKIGSAEEFAQLGNTEEFSKLGNAEEFATLANTEELSKLGNAEEFVTLANTEEFSKLGNAEEFVKIVSAEEDPLENHAKDESKGINIDRIDRNGKVILDELDVKKNMEDVDKVVASSKVVSIMHFEDDVYLPDSVE